MQRSLISYKQNTTSFQFIQILGLVT